MLAKFQNRINATRFHFSVHVHSLQPWPAGSRGIAVGWQRGKRRRGATKSVLPLPNPDKLGTVVRFNEKFDLVSTLYKVRMCKVVQIYSSRQILGPSSNFTSLGTGSRQEIAAGPVQEEVPHPSHS